MNPVVPRDDPAFPVMTMDILTQVLSHADNPADLGKYLTEHIRELTGARCVLFIRCPSAADETAHRVISVNPLRRRDWSESPASQQLYGIFHDLPAAQIWRAAEHPETAELLRPEGFDVSLVVPLHVGTARAGALLALGLPDDTHLASALDLLDTLSTIVALVLSNASLYENQEQAIQERTRDLQASNEMLRKSDAQVRSLLEEAQQARGALLSILEDEKRAQEELRRVNRAMRALSNCNQAVIRATDEAELLTAVCRVVVESGEYRAAWVGYAEENAARSVRPVAQAGFEAGDLDALEITWADTERGAGTTGRAIRTGQFCVARQAGDDPVLTSWQERGLKDEPASSLSLPLFVGVKPLGALNIYSRAADAFDAQETELLSEMAGDLAYGVETLRTRSARARAEAELQLFRHLTDQSNDAIFMVEPPTGRVLDINDTACRVLGYPREELLHLRVADFDLVMRHTSLWAEHLQAVRAAGALTVESTHQRKDGSTFPVEVSVSYVTQDGKDYLIAVIRDITERQRAQTALQRSNELVRAVIEAAPTAIIGLDLNGNVQTVWNPAAEKMLGWSAQEVMGRPLPSVPAESAEEFGKFRERIRRGMTLDGMEVRRQRRDGTRIDYSIYASPLHDAEGRIIGNVAVLVDITERKRAAEELRAKTEELDHYFNLAPDLLCIADTDGHFARLSPSWEWTLGHSREELLAGKFLDFIHPEDVAPTLEAIESLKGQRKVIDFVNRYRCKDGSYRWIEWRSAPVGKRIYAAARDITERKRAERSIALLSFALNNVHEAAFLIDEKAHFHYVNDESCRALGYTRDELLGLSVADIDPDFPPERWRDHWEDLKAQGSLIFEGRHKTKGGRILPVEISANYFEYDGQGYNLALVRDITERMRAVELLHEREQMFRTLVENSPDIIARYDRDCRRIYVNPVYLKTARLPEDELLGAAPVHRSPLAPADAVVLQNLLRQGLDSGVGAAIDLPMPGPEAARLWFNIQTVPETDYEGRIVSVMTISRDITERKRAEERIAAQLREKEMLLREIHHRVKNNMQVISSLLDLQARQAGSERLRELLNASRGRIRTMAMVHERLYTAQDMAHVDLRDYIQALVTESLGLYGVDPDQVEVHVEVEQWAFPIATAIPCGLIIHELLSNTLRHAFPGGRRGQVEISLVRTGDGAVELTVQDDGVGVPEGFAFGTTRSLGLRLVQILAVDQLGGTVHVERENGTRVQVRFAEAQS